MTKEEIAADQERLYQMTGSPLFLNQSDPRARGTEWMFLQLDRIEKKLDWLHWNEVRGQSLDAIERLAALKPWPGDLKEEK